MKIAFICTEKLPVPPVAGGAVQLYIDGILPYLSKENQVTVYSVQHPGLPNEESTGNVRYIRVSGKNSADYIANIKKIITPEYDLVHIFNRPLWVLQIDEKLPDTPISLSLHNEMFHPEKITDEQGLRCIKRVEFINNVSKYIADTIKIRFPSAAPKLRVVYSGADPSRYNPIWSREGMEAKHSLKEKYNLKGYRVVLFVGRLSNKKGVDILMRAMDRVYRKYPRIALIIVGSKWFGENKKDEYTQTLDRIAKEIRYPVVFTGFIPPAEIPRLYNAADIFVCPSQWNEPLARVHYEAMAAGLPIITTNRGGNAEVIDGMSNGLVVNNYNNVDTLASSIIYLLEHPEKASEMGRQGRKLVESRYNWERVSKEILSPISHAGGHQAVFEAPAIKIDVSDKRPSSSEKKTLPNGNQNTKGFEDW